MPIPSIPFAGWIMAAVHENIAGWEQTRENIGYIRQMLGELRQVAEREGADMLCYLLEMAYLEAGDVQSGRRGVPLDRSDPQY